MWSVIEPLHSRENHTEAVYLYSMHIVLLESDKIALLESDIEGEMPA